MTWVRLDDGFAEHPKVMSLTDKAFRLHVSALCYCGRNLTDGYIAPPALKMLMAGCSANKKHLGELILSGLWDSLDRIHDFTDLNPTADEVREKRETRRAAGRLGGLAKAKANAKQDATPGFLPRPGPTHKEPKAVTQVRDERPPDFEIPELRSVS